MHDASNSGSHALDNTVERMRANRETRSLLHKIFHASPSPISIIRLDDGVTVDVNEEWMAFFGYSLEEVIGHSSEQLSIWRDRKKREELLQRVAKESSVHEFELDVSARSGEQKTVVCSSQLIDVDGVSCILTVMNDITEHKRTRNALQESEERFRMMADSAPVLIWVANAEGAYTYVNKTWVNFTGRNPEQAMGKSWQENIHPDDRVAVREGYTRAFGDRTTFSLQYRMRGRDREYRWMLDNGTPRYLRDGSFVGFIGTVIDITAQKETEQKLIEARDHAEEMALLKTTFLTNMTHEIRTPLTVILGFTSILRQGVRSEYHRFINLIERSGRRLLQMLDAMLDLAQLEAGTLDIDSQVQSVTEIVESIAVTLSPLAEERGLQIYVTLPADRCYADVDYGILTRVLNNLVDNAIKFTDEGTINLSVQRKNGTVEVAVRDTGIGIDDRFISQMFDPFTQESSGLDRTHQGSGLGLAVSKRLLEAMGAQIAVQSEKGAGSTFTITLQASAKS